MKNTHMIDITSKDGQIFALTVDRSIQDKKEKHAIVEKQYDPYEFGNVNHPIDYWGAIVHLIRSTIGTGILALPFAFKNVGYGIGIVASIIIGFLYVSNVHALLFTEYHLCRKLRVSNLTFVGVVRKTFEYGPKPLRKMGSLLTTVLYTYYGLPTGLAIYLIIIAQNTKNTYEYFYQTEYSLYTYIFLVAVPMSILCLIPKLKFLVPLSILTNIFTIINICIILIFSSKTDQWNENAKIIENPYYIPQFFAIVLLSLIATGMVLPLKNDMQNPRKFASNDGVLNVSFAILVVLYVIFGVMGYLNYGANTKDNLLANLPADSYVTHVIYFLYTSSLCVTYTLLFYVYNDTIWSNVLKNKVEGTEYVKLTATVLRIAINVVAFLLAVCVPNFGLFSAIVGTMGIVIEIALPSFLQLIAITSIVDTRLPSNYWYYCSIKNIFMIIVALCMFVMSSKTCYVDIIKLYVTSDDVNQ